jgi:hypothetical protein
MQTLHFMTGREHRSETGTVAASAANLRAMQCRITLHTAAALKKKRLVNEQPLPLRRIENGHFSD